MTARLRNGIEEPINWWIRNHPELDSRAKSLSVQNIDFALHRFSVTDAATRQRLQRQHIMLLEVKCYGAGSPFAQRDTFNVLDQCMQYSHKKVVHTAKGDVRIFYHGFHTLILSGQVPGRYPEGCMWRWEREVDKVGGIEPVVSDQMTWDGLPITMYELLKVLVFEIDPITLRPREDRSHHKSHPALVQDWIVA